MRAAPFALGAVVLALSSPLESGASASPTSGAGATTVAEATIALGGRRDIDGPWRRVLRLKLKRGGIPVSFSVCAIWGEQPTLSQSCEAPSGERLPEGSQMRLEQHRKVGWKRVGISAGPVLNAILSSAVGGNSYGTVLYRVTLRQQGSGRILRTSNTFKVVWLK